MKKTKEILELFEDQIQLVEKKLETCKIGDTIYLDKEGSKAYEILDMGVPFCLILELATGFCHLYKGNLIYTTK